MVTILEIFDEYTVHDLIELLRKEPNQNMKISDWCNKFIGQVEEKDDEPLFGQMNIFDDFSVKE